MAIERLPIMLISKILDYEDITITDVVNFSATCQQFRHIIINNNNLWRKKFFQRWPTAKKVYENMLIDKSLYHISIIDVKAATKCTKELWDYVSHMSERHYHYSDIHKYSKDFSSLFLTDKHCLDKHPMHFAFLKDELIRTIYTQWQCDLTQRYYSMKLLQCLVTRNFRMKWQKFKNKPYQQKILEKMFTIVMQWCRPEKYIYYLHIDKFLDDIMQEVLTHLKEETPTHRIFSLSPEQISFWKHNNINENYWGEIEARQIKCILDKIIFNFGSYNLNYPWKSDQIRDGYVQVSHNEKILWQITYTCVARRMGIHVEIAKHFSEYSMYPLNVHLIWNPRGHTEETECFNFLMDRQSNLPLPFICVCRSTSNLVQMLTEQLIETLKMVFQNYIKRDISFLFTSEIDTNDNMCICFRIGQRIRSPKIKFAVGMIIRYKHSESEYNEDVDVIIGWHNNYQIWTLQTKTSYHFQQPDFSQYNAQDRLYYLQPFYFVLMDNSGIIYVPQSAIRLLRTPQWIDNPEVGRYFCRFKRNYYIANDMLEKHYPEDVAVVLKTFNNL